MNVKNGIFVAHENVLILIYSTDLIRYKTKNKWFVKKL